MRLNLVRVEVVKRKILNMVKIDWKHTLVSLPFILIACFFNYEFSMIVIISAYWYSREQSQAEYRWMSTNSTNRAGMPWWAGYDLRLWTRKSLFDDWILPTVVCFIIVIIYNLIFQK